MNNGNQQNKIWKKSQRHSLCYYACNSFCKTQCYVGFCPQNWEKFWGNHWIVPLPRMANYYFFSVSSKFVLRDNVKSVKRIWFLCRTNLFWIFLVNCIIWSSITLILKQFFVQFVLYAETFMLLPRRIINYDWSFRQFQYLKQDPLPMSFNQRTSFRLY